MPDVVDRWTRPEVLALPNDGSRHELVDGELLVSPSPSPAHQVAVGALYEILSRYVMAHGIGLACMAPADLDLRSGQVIQPDVFVVPVHGRVPRTWEEFPIPILAAEVISPATARHDRGVKRRRYQASGIGVYWIIDLDARAVEEWQPGWEQPRVLDELAEWRPEAAVPALAISLPEYFAGISGR